ncbi:Uncharacterised protein [Serratia marcescens]|jgi:hypothetical protein|uniref:Uncharacterized protein n=1 Tax=Serratia marcescens TaxID=615 RepID=A0ABD5IKE8_SERMA|nr:MULTISPECIES: hypothetical protein [Serratia]MBH2846136.1 hypothetical protein [Serratia marcescens]MBH2865679.1 hypothetical protein [Serratia marcescens]MBH2877182.1 hypothetical protein [Serratia marcescens]MBN5375634.1 hypothetical protein [Serratia marcescens]MCA3994496.1 hypothetical protein [Serratia marcescens]
MTDYAFYNQILTRLAANHPGTLDEKTYELWKQDATSPHAFADPFAYLKTKGLIQAYVMSDIDENNYDIDPHQTRITTAGLEFIRNGGFK